MSQNIIVKGIVHRKMTFLSITHFAPKCDLKMIIFHTLIVHICMLICIIFDVRADTEGIISE